jgi:hypothetical protein
MVWLLESIKIIILLCLSNYRDDYTRETQVNTQEDIEPIISKITADFNFVEGL